MMKITTSILLFSFIKLSAQTQDTVKTIELTNVEIIGIRSNTNTPITQKNITEDEIKKSYFGQEISFFLDKTPSITAQSDGGQPNGYTTFRLRGIDQTRINMSLNGVPLNEPEDQGVYFSNYPNFITNIKSFQIQRGVGTSCNGTTAYAGSINFESKTGLDKEFLIETGYGSFNTKRFNASYASGLKKNFAFYSDITGYGSDGYKYHSSGKGYSGFLSGGYYGEKNIVKFTGFSGKSINDMAWYGVSESDIKIDRRINYNPVGEKDDFSQTLGQLQLIHTIDNKSIITTTAFYNRLDGLWGMFVDSINLLKFKLASNLYGLILNYHLETNGLNVNIGGNINQYNRFHSGILDSLLYKNIGYKNDYSCYAKLGYTIKKLTFFMDIQARNVNFSYVGDIIMPNFKWNFFNPKGGIMFYQSNKINYYFSIGKTTREPTRNDIFGGEDDLKTLNIITPESVVDYELGSNIKFDKLTMQYNLFFMKFNNEITLLGAIGSNSLPLMTNVTNSYRSGLECEINFKLNSLLSFNGNATYSYARIVNNETKYQPLYTPKILMNGAINLTINNFGVSFLIKYCDKSFINLDNTQSIPSFVKFDGNVFYKYKNYWISCQLINITNNKYYTSGYINNGEKYLFVNAPLSGYITLKAQF